MNINIKWLKRRTKKVEDKYKMDAYLRTYTIDKDGNRTQPQKRLKGVFKYWNKRLTPEQKRHNDNIDIEVTEFLNNKRKEERQGILDIKSFDKKISSVFEYGKKYVAKLDIKPKSKSAYNQSLVSFEEYFGTFKTFNTITKDDVIALKVHMRDNGRSRYGSPYSLRTINTYMNRLSLITQDALENKDVLCNNNYFKKYGQVKIEKEEKGEYINTMEYSKLDYTKCKSKGIAKAFMFSILSGLRKTDVETMVWGDIEKDETGWHTYKAMQKGGSLIRVTITPMMLELLGERKGEYARIINWGYTKKQIEDMSLWLGITFPKKQIGQQTGRSGIKGLTFHSARASFITNLLNSGIPPVRVQKYVGHKDLKTTLSYYRGKSEMQETDMLKMDSLYRSEQLGQRAKELML